MGAARCSETSANFYQTGLRNVPDVNHLPTRHIENPKKKHSLFPELLRVLPSENILFVSCTHNTFL
jgi:hypothetical protein